MPDNGSVDGQGRLWVALDGNSPSKTGHHDGIRAMERDGQGRGTGQPFFRVPKGAEMCGPSFTPVDRTFFVSVQHPGEADEDDPKALPATFEVPSTRSPDFIDGMPPRPAIVGITKAWARPDRELTGRGDRPPGGQGWPSPRFRYPGDTALTESAQAVQEHRESARRRGRHRFTFPFRSCMVGP